MLDLNSQIELALESEQIYEQHREIEKELEVVDEATEAGQELEEVSEIVEDTQESTGLDPVAAEAIKVALSCIYDKVGLSTKDISLHYSCENFNTENKKHKNTQIALESIKETLVNIRNKIKEFIARVYAKIVEFFKNLFSSVDKIIKVLDNIKAEINAKTRSRDLSTTDKKEIDINTAVANAFVFAGNVLTTKEAKDAIARFNLTEAYMFLNLFSDKIYKISTDDFSKGQNVDDMVIATLSGVGSFEIGDEKNPVAGGFYYKSMSPFALNKGLEQSTLEGLVVYKKVQHSLNLDAKIQVPALSEILNICAYSIDQLKRFKVIEDKTKNTKEKFDMAVKQNKANLDKATNISSNE